VKVSLVLVANNGLTYDFTPKYVIFATPTFKVSLDGFFTDSLNFKHALRSSWQGFSQKRVQPSCGRPFLEEIQGKFT